MSAAQSPAPPVAVRPGGQPPTRRSRGAREDRSRLLFAGPALGFLGVFFVYPLYLLVDTSTREVSLGTASRSGNPSVGLANYQALLADPDFTGAVPRTLVYLVATVLVQLAVGLALAIVLTQRFRGLALPRFLVYFVWLLPPVVSGAVWKFALDGTEQGAVNAGLQAVGLVDDPVVFLADPVTGFAAIALVNAWAGVPFVAIVLTAALKDVDEQLYEAARVDGASPLQRFRNVALPAIVPTLGILTALLVIYSFKAFDFIFVLTQGGPGTTTATVPYLAYVISFAQFDFGLGSAVGVISVLFALVCATPYIVSVFKERTS